MARKRKGDKVDGWIELDKPDELGSTPAVGRVRRMFEAQKAGHGGTLDPLAERCAAHRARRGHQDRPLPGGRRQSLPLHPSPGAATTATHDREGEVGSPSPTCAPTLAPGGRPCCPGSWARSTRFRRPIRRSRSTASAPMTSPRAGEAVEWSGAKGHSPCGAGLVDGAGRGPCDPRGRVREGDLRPRHRPRPCRGARRLREHVGKHTSPADPPWGPSPRPPR